MGSEDIVVIFGAKVRPDGTPSAAVRRRVNAALNIASRSDSPVFLATGASREGGPTEASVMKRMLQSRGVTDDRILIDEDSEDTLASVIHCAALIRARDNRNRVFVCTDRYHIPRCRWLFYLMGVTTVAAPVESGRAANGWLRWTYWFVREVPALPWDTLLILLIGKGGRDSSPLAGGGDAGDQG